MPPTSRGRLVAAAFCLLVCVARLDAAQLVRDGKATAVLVTPDRPSQGTRSAAELIRGTLTKMTGAELSIVAESAGPGPLLPVYVGHTEFARRKGIRQEVLKPEEIVLLAGDDYAVIAGSEGPAGPMKRHVQQGTVFAAVELLHRLGVRWLWPDPTGHVIPRTADVAVENLEYRHAPKVVDRGMRMQVGMGSFHPNVVAKFDRQPGRFDLHDWPLSMRLGGSRSIKAGHSFGDWYERFFESHPEFFARGPDGSFSWFHIKERAKLCVSNPGVLEQVVADAKAYYATVDNPTSATYSLGPNDGQGFCLCPNCRAMDNLSARKESWQIYDPKTGRTRVITHVSLSDRYTKFWNRVAERLEKETPGMTLGVMAYSVYRDVPLDMKKLHPSLALGYVGGGYTNARQREELLRDWNGWSRICSQMFWRPNFMKEGEGFPLVWATQMGEDLKRLISTGLIGVEMPNVHHQGGTQGLNYYMLARIMWDETLDPGAVIDDYCRTGFGSAATDVRRYVARLEDLTRRFARHQVGVVADFGGAVAQDEDPDSRRGGTQKAAGVSAWEVVWTDAALMDLERDLIEAASSVEAASPEAVRVAILREGFDFAKLEVLVRRAMDKMTAKSSQENEYDLLLAVARIEQWLLAHPDSKAVGVVEGAPYWWRGKRGVPLFNRQTILGRSVRVAADRYLLTVPAYSMRGRFVSIEFSADGKTWSAPEPYRVQHEYTAPAGARTVLARLTFKDTDGVKPQKPIEIEL